MTKLQNLSLCIAHLSLAQTYVNKCKGYFNLILNVYLTIIITTNAISLLHLIVYALSLQYVILLSFQLECDCVIRHFMRNFDMKVIRTRRQ